MDDLTKKFINALGDLHRNGNVAPLVDLFADDATLNKAGMPHGQHGKDGARTFWEQYRHVFDQIEATFSHTVTDDGIAYLEWTSNGTLADGTDFSYDGVSVLEGSGDAIEAFRTYYDTAAFLEKKSAVD
ncbi:epoxide hydrolase [Mycobacterium antarcticum]|uniref:nuclear transport factor 2 family protein n=1 Tax=unclassified Mycolicibacterium TaxID=2636767 RepID=UPI002384CCC8|nr:MULTISPECIES: nuclear transport factor 2 family protein [unclassified Mycolicibacterium]BDX35085.1 epoxide hydrolase [Mycolicibacterium sp. TUM20985]GLP81364.1 epoxide hydrolase [Mycolicibacterium sp. TUM20984]